MLNNLPDLNVMWSEPTHKDDPRRNKRLERKVKERAHRVAKALILQRAWRNAARMVGAGRFRTEAWQ